MGGGVCTECEWRNVESSSLNLPASCLPTPKPTCLNLIGRGAVLLCKQPTYGENCRPQCLPVYPGARGELVKHVSVVLRFPRSKSCCIPYLKPCCVSIRRANELANTPVPLERGRVQGLNVSGRLRDESRRCCDDIHGSAVTHTLPNLGGYRKECFQAILVMFGSSDTSNTLPARTFSSPVHVAVLGVARYSFDKPTTRQSATTTEGIA